MARIRFDELDLTKSLVSQQFEPRPLLIGNPAAPKSLIDFSLIQPKPAADGKKLAQN